MAASKKKSKGKPKVKGGNTPASRDVRMVENPDSAYSCKPSWNFHMCDKEGLWAFTKDRLKDVFWEKILPFLSNLENNTWEEILIGEEKQNHTVSVEGMNRSARKRLEKFHPDSDVLVSLHLGGTLRIYGILDVSTLCILWYDDNHGDNDTCVYRSHKKHT